MTKTVIKDRGRVTTDAPDGYPSRAFPGICVLPSGRWLCGFRGAVTKDAVDGQNAFVTWSDDRGATWSTPAPPFQAPDLDGRSGRFRALFCTPLDGRVLATLYWVDASEAGRPFFNESTEGLLDSRIFHSVSADGGATWSTPALMDTTPYHQPAPITGPALVMPDGCWACQFELNKPYTDPAPWRHASVMMFSRDGGRTWPESVEVCPDPENRVFYWDQRPALLRDGSLLDVFWTYDRKAGAYLNIHATRSIDGGRSWSPPWDTGVPGQPAPVVALDNTVLAMVYMDRTARPALKLRISRDSGATWPAYSERVLEDFAALCSQTGHATMQDAWTEMGAFASGLPATCRTPDGEPLVVYYAGPHTDRTDIHWMLLDSAALQEEASG
ncbi:MAG TPA: sialidase family protein [Candidatus Hydrogenedentes bacterium]|nr:sialidase family protein [Candidatus Hydrogenedentota bacterium]HQH53696.1 sialidase family protein [Candidatus Hydrogenedentota bacterium]HQM49767.1 sialidase family protein [Candidatus Hydrogenedentota bacterium]